MSHDSQSWEDYLSRRPSLNKWLQCSEQNGFFHNRVSFMQDMIETGGETEYGRKVADLDDGEALAYFMYLGIGDSLLINSKAVKHIHQPSISLEEANLIDKQDVPYIDLICARETDKDSKPGALSENIVFTGHILETIDYYRSHDLPHIVWDTEYDLVRTVIRYKSYCNLFKTSYDAVIDSDYLDDYLLAPKPDPIEIDKNTWHDMSVRLINWLDEENEKTKDTRFLNNDLLGFMADGLASCFLTYNIEDLTFMETIYDFCVFASNYPAFMDRNVRDSYRPGMLDPELFDLLREYGSAFVEPLLENTLIMKGERTS